MKRLPDWESRLYAYLRARKAAAFDPVSSNCAIFVAGLIEAMTGEDPVEALGVTLPGSALGAARILAEFGGVRGLAERYFGAPAVPAALAGRGDILIAAGDLLIEGSTDRETLGVSDGSQALFVGPRGLERFPLSACSGCWRLG